jgi:hypothetical protein
VSTVRPHASLPCGQGWGVAVCAALQVVVVSCKGDGSGHCLVVFSIEDDLSLVERRRHCFGSLCFGDVDAATGCSGKMCFTVRWDVDRTLLVADHVGSTVHEFVVTRDTLRRCTGSAVPAVRGLDGPRAVAASRDYIAVSSWAHPHGRGRHGVFLFTALERRFVRVVGRSDMDAAGRPLCRPYGLRLSSCNKFVVVVDAGTPFGHGQGRLLRFCVGEERPAFVDVLSTGVHCAHDVEECQEGWLVAHTAGYSVSCVPHSPTARPVVQLGGYGDGSNELGLLAGPLALALAPGLGLAIRELNAGRLQILSEVRVDCMLC